MTRAEKFVDGLIEWLASGQGSKDKDGERRLVDEWLEAWVDGDGCGEEPLTDDEKQQVWREFLEQVNDSEGWTTDAVEAVKEALGIEGGVRVSFTPE